MDKISVIIPTFNGSRYIRQALDSCLRQTHENIEVVVVDDGSTDGTPDVVAEYDDPRIVLLQHEKNGGLPKALNTGFARASGEFMTWTSDDNFYADDALERMLSFLKERGCDFVYCDYYKFEGEDVSSAQLVKVNARHPVLPYNGVGPCFLYTRQVREEIGDFDVDTFLAEDYDYWIRVWKKFKMCRLSKPIYFYRTHPTNLSQTRESEIKALRTIVKVKNEIVTVDEAAREFIREIAREKYPGESSWFRLFCNVVSTLLQGRVQSFYVLELVYRVIYLCKVKYPLGALAEGKISFKAARESLLSFKRSLLGVSP
ncbi:MAG: hypothetical protein Kow0069_28170 [Promethearchaeota archaeon]